MGGKCRKENEICLIFLFGQCNNKPLEIHNYVCVVYLLFFLCNYTEKNRTPSCLIIWFVHLTQ